MRNKIIKIGFLLAVCFSLAGSFSVGAAKAEKLENIAESSFAQAGKGCKVTKKGGSTMYAASLDKDVFLRRGTYLTVVVPEPQQGIIVVKARVKRKLTQGEIRIDDTNCVPILPQ